MAKAPKLLAAVLLAVVMTAACGKSKSSSSSNTTESTTSTTSAAPTVKVATDAKFGKILVDANGMSLYHFDKDSAGVSNCSGGCATTWPPALLPTGVSTPVAPSGVTGLGVVTRADGGVQVAYNNLPQYRYSKDAKAGDTTGDGVGGVWHITVVS